MPSFVISFMLVLLADLALIYQLLMATEEGAFMLIVVLLIFLIPLAGLLAAPAALNWQRQCLSDDSGPASTESALARLTCVSSLAFLGFASLISLFSGAPKNFYLLFALVYFLVQALRLQHGMWVNLAIAVYILVKPARPGDRLFAAGAALGAGAGLSLMASPMAPLARQAWHWAISQSPPPASALFGVALFAVIGFGYGLMWGAVSLWGLKLGHKD